MRTAAPTQLPLFRSEGQARLLTRLFLSFGRPVGQLDGVAKALIYGSWAARYQNQPGPPPNDLDVLVVGNPQRRALVRTTRELSEELGLEVDPHVVSLADYEEGTTGFLRTIKQGPVIELDLEAGR